MRAKIINRFPPFPRAKQFREIVWLSILINRSVPIFVLPAFRKSHAKALPLFPYKKNSVLSIQKLDKRIHLSPREVAEIRHAGFGIICAGISDLVP